MDVGQLDAVSAVLGAIAASAGAGAGDAVKDMTKGAVIETRDRLLALLRSRLKKDTVGDAKLIVFAAEPNPSNGKALEGHLVDAGIGHDQDILALARELLEAAGPAALAPGSVAASVIKQVNTHGGIGFQDGNHVHNYGAQASPHVSWELYRLEGHGYELRNTGTATAHDVTITANVDLAWLTPVDQQIPAGSSVMFICEPRLADPSPVLTVVSGTVPGGPERQRWQRPLPR